MEKNAYYDLGLKLAFQQAGFSDDFLKDAGVWSAIKGLFTKEPAAKGSFEAWKKSDKARKLMGQRSATGTAAYDKFRQGGILARRSRVA